MRGAPQVGFSATMRKMRSRISLDVCLLPRCLLVLEISLQYRRKPARCQRITVSEVTMIRDRFQPSRLAERLSRRACRSYQGSAADGAASARQVVGVMPGFRGEDFDTNEGGEPRFRSR